MVAALPTRAGYRSSALVGVGGGDGGGGGGGGGDGDVAMPALPGSAASPAGGAQLGRLELQVPGLAGLSAPGVRIPQRSGHRSLASGCSWVQCRTRNIPSYLNMDNFS